MNTRNALKRLRRMQPLNRVMTSGLKSLFDATGWRPETVVKHLPRVGLMEVTLPDGLVLRLDSSGEDWIPTQLFWHGWLAYEPEVTPLFFKLAQGRRGADVGAHIGFFTVL